MEHKEYVVPEEALEEIAKKYTDIIERNGKFLGVKIRVDLDEDGKPWVTADYEEINKEGK